MKKVILLILILVTQNTFGHGEEKLGPHKGYIKMPGAFHTELVLTGKNTVKVYLLDINWQNPSIKNSSLSMILNKTEKAKCQVNARENYFECEFKSKFDLNKKGDLSVIAQRESQRGMEVIYSLPLKLSVKDSNSLHDMHH